MQIRFIGNSVGLALLTLSFAPEIASAGEPVDIGARRELFVDELLIDSVSGDAERIVQQPVPHEVVLVTDQPWEGNTCAYYTLFEDDGLFRMYYRGAHYNTETRKATHPEVTCYAESRDGIHWTKPNLGLFEFEGSTENNIVWAGVGTHDFTPFKDENPDGTPDARYKAFGRGGGGEYAKGLWPLKSADAIHWKLMADGPVITQGAFDSQNLAFWDSHAGLYREFHRTFRGVRDIQTGTSSDFLHWTDPVFLDYGDAPLQHLYTNAIRVYPRAPHMLIGFPTRFFPDQGQRVEPTFMASRDGLHFRRWLDPVIPESAPADRAGNRSNYMTWGLLELPGHDGEYSVYATEAYYTGPDSRVRRFTYRYDGFVALHAGADGGELLTKPLTFDGDVLHVNYKAAGSGSLRVELQNANGEPIEGFAAKDCQPLTGDEIEGVVTWKSGAVLADLAGKPVRIRFVARNADVYSFKFSGG
jgi:hypothetical protein